MRGLIRTGGGGTQPTTTDSSGNPVGAVVISDAPAVRNDGTSSEYSIAREEANGVILDAGTSAQAVSGGAPAHLQGVLVATALAGTLTIDGLLNVSDSATSIVLPIATAAGTYFDFKGARCETALVCTLSDATDDVVVFWRPI